MEQCMSLCGREALTVPGRWGWEPTAGAQALQWGWARQTLVMLWKLCTLVTEVPTCTKSVRAHEHVQTQT